MKIITWTGILSILAGLTTSIITSVPTKDLLALRPSAGYVLFIAGIITVLIDRLATRESKTVGLLASGLILILFGERLPAIIFSAVFGKEANADFRDAGMIFLFLGVSCTLISWVLMVLSADQKK